MKVEMSEVDLKYMLVNARKKRVARSFFFSNAPTCARPFSALELTCEP